MSDRSITPDWQPPEYQINQYHHDSQQMLTLAGEIEKASQRGGLSQMDIARYLNMAVSDVIPLWETVTERVLEFEAQWLIPKRQGCNSYSLNPTLNVPVTFKELPRDMKTPGWRRKQKKTEPYTEEEHMRECGRAVDIDWESEDGDGEGEDDDKDVQTENYSIIAQPEDDDSESQAEEEETDSQVEDDGIYSQVGDDDLHPPAEDDFLDALSDSLD